MEREREGWMCSIDFGHELGMARGGNSVYPSEENCRANRKCVTADGPNPDYDCYPIKVAVLPADELASLRTRNSELVEGITAKIAEWRKIATYERTPTP